MERVYIGGIYAGILYPRNGYWFAESREGDGRLFRREQPAREFIYRTFTACSERTRA
jgi:hypothetical protein